MRPRTSSRITIARVIPRRRPRPRRASAPPWRTRGGAGQRAHERRLRHQARAPARFHAPDATRASARKLSAVPRALDAPDLRRRPVAPPRVGRRDRRVSGRARLRLANVRGARRGARRPARGLPGAATSRPSLAEKHQIAVDNASLRRRLENQYRAGPTPSWSARDGADLDGLAMWAERLRVYDARPLRARRRRPSRDRKCLRTGVAAASLGRAVRRHGSLHLQSRS